jgi:hypothetical protein
MGPDGDSGQVVVGGSVGGDDFSLGGFGCSRDDEVVGASWSALASHCHEQLSMGCSDRCVVVHDGDNLYRVVDELLERGSVLGVGQMHTDEELGDSYGGDGHLVVVSDEIL